MNNYSIDFNVYRYEGQGIKDKVDYSIIPVSVINSVNRKYKSDVSDATFEGFKLTKINGKKYCTKLLKKKKSFYFQIIVYTDKEMEETEKEFLPIICKYISKKLWYKFNLIKALKKRVEFLCK